MFSPVLQFIFCYIFVTKLSFGIKGTGYAGTCTNLIIFIIQNRILRKVEIIHDIKLIYMSNRQNFSNICLYLKLAIPSLLCVLIEWSAYEI